MSSTPEGELSNWYKFSEKDTRQPWEIEDPDTTEEDDYSEDSDPDTE